VSTLLDKRDADLVGYTKELEIGYVKLYPLGFNAVYSVESEATFRRNMSPPSSESTNNPSKEPGKVRCGKFIPVLK
jgi:hypothetical protein